MPVRLKVNIEQLFRDSKDLVILFDGDQRIVYHNRVANNFFTSNQIDPQKITLHQFAIFFGLNIQNFSPPNFSPFFNIVKYTAKTNFQNPYRMVVNLISQSSEKVYFLFFLTPLTRKPEKKDLELIARDNSPFDELKDKHFFNFAENFNDVIVIYDRQLQKLVYCNSASEKVLGIPAQELLDKNKIFLYENFIYKADRPVLEAAQKKFALLMGQGKVDTAPIEFRINHPQGKIRWILQQNFPEMIGNKMSHRVFMVFSDITERKNLEKELQRYAQHLEDVVSERTHSLRETYHELEAFTYSISHDLRSPLRHIHGFSRILEEEFSANLSPMALDYLQRIQHSAIQMSKLIDELLKLFGIGRKEMNYSKTDLNQLIADVIEELKPEYQNRDIEWSIMTFPMIKCDPMLIKQVFINIISNAIKFTKNRNKARIQIGVRNQSTVPQFFISDNGIGFDMKYIQKLFIPFQRLHRPDEFEGNGIGLALTQRIIKRHRGRIWAESEPNVGTKIWFTLNEY